jgi:hypothetical protein
LPEAGIRTAYGIARSAEAGNGQLAGGQKYYCGGAHSGQFVHDFLPDRRRLLRAMAVSACLERVFAILYKFASLDASHRGKRF